MGIFKCTISLYTLSDCPSRPLSRVSSLYDWLRRPDAFHNDALPLCPFVFYLCFSDAFSDAFSDDTSSDCALCTFVLFLQVER